MKKTIINILELGFGILAIVLIIFAIRFSQTIVNGTKEARQVSTNSVKTEEENTTDKPGGEADESAKENITAGNEQTSENADKAEEKPAESMEDTKTADSEVSDNNVTMAFTGDVLLTGYLLTQYDKSGIEGILQNELLEEIKNADIAMINEEFPFSTRGTPMQDKQYTFRIEPERVSVFKDMGVDIVTLANNHALDYGQDALVDTFDTLNKAGIKYAGAGNNNEEAKELKTFELKGKTIGILAASRVIPVPEWTAGTSPGMFTTYDPTGLINEITAAREKCDSVIVYVHWGIEKSEYPEEYQRELAKKYIDAGADMVVGAHPHVLQGIEYYNGKPVIYSLGNFIFGSQIAKTVLLKVNIDEDNQLGLSLTACKTNQQYILEKADNSKEIYDYLTGISTNAVVDADGNISEKR